MKVPGPDHPITITANPKRIRVLADGVVIADTTHALTLKEASYPAVQYVPRADAKMDLLQRTDRTTHCPYKGDASYFSIRANGKTLDNAIWTYEMPFPAMAEITSLSEAVAGLIRDGQTVALEGFTHLIPSAAGHEIIRQRRTGLTLVRMTPDLIYDQLIGTGCSEKLMDHSMKSSWNWIPTSQRLLPIVGSVPRATKPP